MNNAKAVTAARHLAATGVPWEDGTARCPLCGQRLHTISSGQRQFLRFGLASQRQKLFPLFLQHLSHPSQSRERAASTLIDRPVLVHTSRIIRISS